MRSKGESKMDSFEFILNGKSVIYEGSASDRLLDILRDYFHLTAVKCGCKEGACGACSVIINGKLTNSCIVSVGSIIGDNVTTLEGYRNTEKFKILDKAFADCSAVQCGFCTSGMIMAAECILSANPHPDEDEIRYGLSGNLCRCTGYNAIVRAIMQASREGDGLW